jgi:hypothetical protein
MPVDASTPTSPARPSLGRKLKFTLIALVAGIALLAVITRGTPDSVRAQLEAMRAAGEPTDATSLATWIPPVPASENGAIKLLELIDGFRGADHTQVPRRARSWNATNLAWAAAESARLQSWRNDVHTALQATRFRYPLGVTNGVANLRISHLSAVKNASTTLAFWASHSAALKLPDESASALLDAIRTARTFDDEPILISWLVRAACLSITAVAAENALTLTAFPDARLAELQAAFLNADRSEPLSRALITERTFGLEVLQSSPSQYVKLNQVPSGIPGAPSASNVERITATLAQTGYQLSGGQGSDTEYYLKTLRELIEISRLSGPARMNALLKLQNRFDKESNRWNRHRSRATAEALFEAAKKDQRAATILRSASVGCAIERFRNAHQGKLPSSLADLIPTYLPSIPLDPANDQPLRFRPLNPGFVVYGVGPDGEDNQGNSVRKLGAGDAGTDLTFTVER